MAIDQEFLKVRQQIGNSFLRAFYPIDYRSSQNVLNNIDKLLDRETKGLRTLSSTTSLVSQKLSKALNGITQDMSEMQSELDKLITSSNANDEIMKLRLEQIDNTSSNLLGLLGAGGLLAELLRRKVAASRRRAREEAKRKKAEEAKRKKAEEAKRAKAEEEAKRAKKPVEAESGKGTGEAKPEPKPESKPTTEEGKGKGGSRFGGKAVAGANIFLAAYALYEMWQEIQALDPNMKKGAYRQALLQIIGRTAGQVGLAWIGAFVGAVVAGTLIPGLGAIPGFLVGLASGAAAQYAYGDQVDEIVDQLIDYLYTGDEEEEAAAGDASMTEREAPTPSLTPAAMASIEGGRDTVDVAPPIAGPVPPAPPMEQTVYGPTSWPAPLPPVDMAVPPPADDTKTKARSAAAEAENKVRVTVPIPTSQIALQTPEQISQFMQSMNSGVPYNQTQTGASDTTANVDTSQNLAGDTSTGTGNVKVVEAYGPRRPGRPSQQIRDIAVRAAESVGMSQITFTSGVGDWISPERRKNGQKTTKHSEGIALDVTGFESQAQRVAFMQAARQLGAGGIGAYRDGSVHIDTGPARVWDGAVGVPGLAEGAKVAKPTLALIGEGGEPEYVVPQSKAIKFAHEMISTRPRIRTKKHTHVVVMPILT